MRKRKVLIANRGEIAVRIVRACAELGFGTVLAVSEADRDSLGAQIADETVVIGPPHPTQSYLDVPKVLAAAATTGVDAIHPGYGFLAENPALPEACEKGGITFIGPRAATMRQLGDKVSARRWAARVGVPTAGGSGDLHSVEDLERETQTLGFPAILKAAAGGGGRGMRVLWEPKELRSAFHTAASEARAAFGDSRLFVERFIESARHVEVQIVGDGRGNVVHLGHRDCTAQRRHQKMIEEAPAYDLDDTLSGALLAAAVRLTSELHYRGAGTVEFLVDRARNEFYFMEVNTRLQVEHPVTEEVTGFDIVKEQLRIAFGAPLSLRPDELHCRGHAIECRITAEDPADDFFPCPGDIETFAAPSGDGVRVDTHCYSGYSVGPFYDSLLAKLIVSGANRAAALQNMRAALQDFEISGIATNIPFLEFAIARPEFARGDIDTGWLERDVVPAFAGAAR